MDNETLDLYRAAARLLECTAADRQYIAELEKQLEHCNPGILKEIKEFLGRE